MTPENVAAAIEAVRYLAEGVIICGTIVGLAWAAAYAVRGQP